MLLEYIHNRLSEFDLETESKRIKLVRSSRHNYICWLIIVKYFLKKEKLNVKKICNYLNKYISRQSVFELISNFENLNIITKITHEYDNRQKLIIPSMDFFIEYCAWVKIKFSRKKYIELIKKNS